MRKPTPKEIDDLKRQILGVCLLFDDSFYNISNTCYKLNEKIKKQDKESKILVHFLKTISWVSSFSKKVDDVDPFINPKERIIELIDLLKKIQESIENLKSNVELNIEVPTFGFGEEDAGRIEAEQAMNQFGDLGGDENSFINGYQQLNISPIINSMLVGFQDEVRNLIENIDDRVWKFNRYLERTTKAQIQNKQLLKLANETVSFEDINELIENLLKIYKNAYGDKNSQLSLRIYDFSAKYSLNIPSLNEAVNVYDDCLDEFKLFVENRLLSQTIKNIRKKINDTCKFIMKSINHIEACKDKAVGEIEITTYGYDNEDFEGSLEAEQASFLFDGGGTPVETGTLMVDINLIGNAFIEEMKNILQNLILEIKDELNKFEKQILLKSEGSYFDSLLKLSSEFARVNKKEVTTKDVDGLKNKLIKVLNDNKTVLRETMRLAERFHKKIQDENEDELPNVVYLTQISNCMGHLLSLTSDMSNINPFLTKQTLNIFNSIIFSFKNAIKQLENFKPTSLLITVPTYGFGEENAGRVEAEQAINQFGDLAESSFINGEQTVDCADILNQIITETQEIIRKIIAAFEKLINGFTKRYYWTD